MPDVPMDTCGNCAQVYAITRENAFLNVYVTHNYCNNVTCKCPHCEHGTRIFLSPESVIALLQDLPIYVHAEPKDDVKDGWASVNFPEPRNEDDPPVFISPRELRKLQRDLDAFEHGVDG